MSPVMPLKVKPADDLAEVAAAIVAAYALLRKPDEPQRARVWQSSGQVAPHWSDGGRRRGWKDADRGRGWQR